VCYINTVSRFAFAYDRYVGALAPPPARAIVDRLVRWDLRAAQRPTLFVANSRNVAQRVARYYGRDSEVLHCPVDVDRFTIGRGEGDYFFIASRLLPYKRIDLAVDAARLAGARLLVAGTGPAEAALRERARGSRVEFLGYVDDERRNALMGASRAVILPGEEDFGLVPLEAAAAGRPSIALRAGGALETIVEGRTGRFFDEAAPASLAAVLADFDDAPFDPLRLRAHAETFAPDRFVERLRAIVERARA
jgi:glycosyltransferase involved in cell wall biosynthesis